MADESGAATVRAVRLGRFNERHFGLADRERVRRTFGVQQEATERQLGLALAIGEQAREETHLPTW